MGTKFRELMEFDSDPKLKLEKHEAQTTQTPIPTETPQVLSRRQDNYMSGENIKLKPESVELT